MINRRPGLGTGLFPKISNFRWSQRTLRWAILLATCGLFFLMQHLAISYHNSNYNLLTLNQIQADYAVIYAPNLDPRPVNSNSRRCNRIGYPLVRDSLGHPFVGLPPSSPVITLENCTNFVNYFFNNVSTFGSSARSPLIDTEPALHSLMNALNRTFVDQRITYVHNPLDSDDYRQLFRHYYHDDYVKLNNIDSSIKDQTSIRSSKIVFDPNNNLDDRIHYLYLKQNFELDRLLQRNDSSSSRNQQFEASIDRRRKLGQLTNLKRSEFINITQIRYGRKQCEPGFGSNLALVMFVITKVDDFEIRQLIRQTWAKRFLENPATVRLYFCFGQPEPKSTKPTKSEYSNAMIDQLVKREHRQFGDIIQWEFMDGYYRLTIKSLAILRWASVYCPRAPNLLKLDTDSVVNYDNLIQFTKNTEMTNLASQYLMYGYMWQNSVPFRSPKSKFFTSHYDYPEKRYPTYLGSVWLLSGEGLPLILYSVAVRHLMPALLWEDLYITGICGQKLIDSGVPVQRRMMPAIKTIVPFAKITQCQFNRTILYTQLTDSPITRQHWNQLIVPETDTNSSCKQEWGNWKLGFI